MIAAIVMLAGIAFIAVITASITATFVENARRRLALDEENDLAPNLDRIASELHAINARLDRLEAGRGASDRSDGDA